MADATGTPTSPDNIPTYSTSGDAPSGKGFNTAMTAIQAALSKRPAYTLTTSAWSAGPPATPSDGDTWVATGVDPTDAGAAWTFRYNAGVSSPYKWGLVGGHPVQVTQVNLNTVINTVTSPLASWFYYPGQMSIAAARAGDYLLEGLVCFYSNGDANVGDCTLNGMVNGALVAGLGVNQTREATAANDTLIVPFFLRVIGNNAGGVIGVAGNSPNNAVWKFGQVHFRYLPTRVA